VLLHCFREHDKREIGRAAELCENIRRIAIDQPVVRALLAANLRDKGSF
jgi:hypothetical protein